MKSSSFQWRFELLLFNFPCSFITGSLLIFLAIQYTVQYSTNKTYLIRNCNTIMHVYSDDPFPWSTHCFLWHIFLVGTGSYPWKMPMMCISPSAHVCLIFIRAWLHGNTVIHPLSQLETQPVGFGLLDC